MVQAILRVLALLSFLPPFLSSLQISSNTTLIPDPCMLAGANTTYSQQDIFSSVCVQEDTSQEVFGFGFSPPSPSLSGDTSGSNVTNYTFVGTGDPDLCNATIVDVFSVINCSDPSVCNSSYSWPPLNNSGTFYVSAY